jgi:hypothetical protein
MRLALIVVVVGLVQAAAAGAPPSTGAWKSQPVTHQVAVPDNLLTNPGAELGGVAWLAIGDAKVERWAGNPCFTVRNGGVFAQEVPVPAASGGSYLVMLGRGASERIDEDGSFTGLPRLDGDMKTADQKRLLGILTGQNMLGFPRAISEWTTMWGVFQVPAGVELVTFRMGQGRTLGVPHNGSAARFDDLALFLVATKTEADHIVRWYAGQ